MKKTYKILLIISVFALLFIGGAIDHWFFLPKITQKTEYKDRIVKVPVPSDSIEIVEKIIPKYIPIYIDKQIIESDSFKIYFNRLWDSVYHGLTSLPANILGSNLYFVTSFEVTKDTVVDKKEAKMSMSLSYQFPSNDLIANIKYEPKPVDVKIKEMIKTETIQPPWYNTFWIGGIVGALGVGLITWMVK